MNGLNLGLGLNLGSTVGVGVDQGLALLEAANHWYDTKDITSDTQQTIANRGTAGGLLTLGTTGGAEGSDPTPLPWVDRNYAWLPNVNYSLNYLQVTPNASAPAGDVEVIWHGHSSIAQQDLGGWYVGAGMAMYLHGTLYLRGHVTPETTANGFTNLAVHGLTGAAERWFKLKRIASTGTTTLEHSTDGISYTTIGTQVIAAGENLKTGGQLRAGVMGAGAGRPSPQKVYAMTGGNIGSVATKIDAADATLTTWPGVTVVRHSSGLKTAIVTRSKIIIDGVDDVFSGQTFTTPYVVKQVAGAAPVMVQENPTTVLAAAEILAIIDRGSTYSAGEQTDILDFVTAGAYS